MAEKIIVAVGMEFTLVDKTKVKHISLKGNTVESLRSSYMLTNKNGRKASISKGTGRLTVY